MNIMVVSTTQSGLPINLDNLIHRRVVENERVEFKASWDDLTKKTVVRSVCAFANDLLNNNGGYRYEKSDTVESRVIRYHVVLARNRARLRICFGLFGPLFLS